MSISEDGLSKNQATFASVPAVHSPPKHHTQWKRPTPTRWTGLSKD